jgi:KaiC/GvpD/RAD55 family RecA-like ATPase
MQRLKDSNKMLLIFKVKRKQTVKGTTKGAEYKKREQLSYAQALSQQLQQESGTEMDTLVSGVKKFIKAYGKEKDILISTVRVMRHLFYMLKINMTLQRYHKSIKRQVKQLLRRKKK